MTFIKNLMIKEENLKEIANLLKKIPTRWDGKESILEMKNNNGKNWKQMEWIGFYFEYLCQKYLKEIMEFHKIKYGRTSFDGFLDVPFDFKTHILNSISKTKDSVINDTEAILNALQDYRYMVIIMVLGNAEYNDINRTFQNWHEEIKGGKSKYELDRIKRKAPSRLRKIRFDVKEIIIFKFDKNILERCKGFQKGFRNSNGKPRRPKVSLNPNDLLENEIIGRIKF